MGMDRREFVKAGALLGTGVAAAVAVVVKDRQSSAPRDPTGPVSVRDLKSLENVPEHRDEDVLVRMQRELVRAMAKPAEERRWVMVIDKRKCVG